MFTTPAQPEAPMSDLQGLQCLPGIHSSRESTVSYKTARRVGQDARNNTGFKERREQIFPQFKDNSRKKGRKEKRKGKLN